MFVVLVAVVIVLVVTVAMGIGGLARRVAENPGGDGDAGEQDRGNEGKLELFQG